MNIDKPQQLKIDTSIKLDENNNLISKTKLDKPVYIDSKCSKANCHGAVNYRTT